MWTNIVLHIMHKYLWGISEAVAFYTYTIVILGILQAKKGSLQYRYLNKSVKCSYASVRTHDTW